MKKKLLSEAQVRRFMGLAGIHPLNEMADYKKDDEPMEEMMHNEGEEDLMEEEDEDLGVEMDDDMGDKGGDADVEMDEEDLADVKSALDTLQDKLAPLLDQAEGGEDMDMDMGDDKEEPEMDMDMGGEEEGEDDMEKELQEVDMELTEEEKEEQTEQIVNEVARRVAKRIVEAKRAHKRMTEALGRSRRRK